MTPMELEEYAKEIKSLRVRMDEAGLNQNWENGRRLSMDECIAYALEASNA